MCKARSRLAILLLFLALMQLLKSGTGALGLAVYDAHGNMMRIKRLRRK